MARFKMVPVYKGRFSRKSDKPPQLAPLNPTQQQMLAIGNAGLDDLKKRLMDGRDEHDAPYPPLSRRWAYLKAKITKTAARRDFKFGFGRDKRGRFQPKHPEDTLLHNFRIRKVSEVMAEARNSTARARLTAGGTGNKKTQGLNQLYQDKGRKGWALWSPRNLQAAAEATRRILGSPIRIIFRNFVVMK